MSYMSGVPLNPQYIVPVDLNIVASTVTTVNYVTVSTLNYATTPTYQNISSGSYTIYINSQSDVTLQTDRGLLSNIGYFNYSTVADTLIGSGNTQFMFQTKNDYSYFPLVSRVSPFSTAGWAIAWNGTMYVAAGQGLNTLATSVDGITWVPRGLTAPLLTTAGYTVTWNGSLWFVGGSSGGAVNTNLFLTSPDGVTWTSYVNCNITLGVTMSKGAWASGLPTGLGFAAIGDTSSSIYTSSNGITWTFRSSNYIGGIAWNGTYFVIASTTSTTYRSADGISWSSGTLPQGANLNSYGIAWSPTLGIWVCAGYVSAAVTVAPLSYSYDGLNWVACTMTSFVGSGAGMYDIAWNGTYFVTVGYTNATYVPCYYSSDGITFTTTGFYPPNICYAISWNGTVWVAGGASSTTSMFYNTSPNCTVAWTNSTNVFTTQCYDIKFNGTLLVAVGLGTNSIAFSTNGLSWTGIPTSNANFSSYGTGILWASDLGLWIALGLGTNRVITSPDAVNWTARDGPGSKTAVFGSAWSPPLNQWALVGSGTGFISTTKDFLGWQVNTIFTTQGWCVIWGNNIWVAGGGTSGTLIATSPDGVNWTPRMLSTQTVPNIPITSIVYGLAYNGSTYVAVGSGTNSIATSPDAITWTGQTLLTIFSTTGRGVTWSSALAIWVAVGTGTNSIAVSSNGTSWTPYTTTTIFATSGYGIVWNPTAATFIAVGAGTNTIATSVNAIQWLGTSLLNALMTTVYCIAWNGSYWVAGGTGANAIASSPDGINWTGGGAPGPSPTYGVAWNGYYWMSVGALSTSVFAYSQNAPYTTWTQAGSTGITGTGYGIIWWAYGGMWVACGSSSQIATITSTSPTVPSLTFTSRTGLTTSYAIAAYRGLIVVVGGPSPVCATSTDGITFTTNTAATPTYTVGGITTGYGVAYSPTLSRWVIAGVGTPTIAYSAFSSPNDRWSGINTSFNSAITTPIFTTQAFGVIWNGTYFVAVGQGTNVLATSADGSYWRLVAQPNTYTTIFRAVATRAPITVAAGNGTNPLCYSLDNGNTWVIGVNGAAIFTSQTYVTAWNGYIWVAGGAGTNTLASSLDGITWTARGIAILTTNCFDIIWADKVKLWVAVGNGTNSIATSPDGVNWTARSKVATTGFSGAGYRVGWNGSQFVAIGNGTPNSMALSTNGTAWTFIGAPITNLTSGYGGVAWNGVLWAVVSDAAATIWTSTNGFNWTSAATLTAGNCRHVAWNGKQFLVVGNSTYCATSPDGITWTNNNTQPQTTIVRSTWNHLTSMWMVASITAFTAVYMTPNGITWTQTHGAFSLGQASYYSFIWSNSLNLWAMGGGTSYNISTTPDASVWTNRVTTSMGTCYAVAWNGVYFVAGGGTTVQIYTSTDGFTWTTRTNGGLAVWTTVFCLAWSSYSQIWVAGGQNGASNGVLAYTNDATGATGWTLAPTGGNTIFGASGACYSIAVNNGANTPQFVAAGAVSNVFASSADGKNWTAQGTGGSTTFNNAAGAGARGIVYAKNMTAVGPWFAVGYWASGGGSIATSTNGTTWTTRTSTNTFGTAGFSIATNYDPYYFLPLVPPITSVFPGITITTIAPSTPSSGSVTYTTQSTHTLVQGQSITIASLTTAGYNGTFTVTTVTTNTFVVANATTGGTTTGQTGTITGYPTNGSVSYTTGGAPKLAVNQSVVITGLTTAGYNVNFSLVTATTATTFTITNATVGGVVTAQSGLVSAGNPLGSATMLVATGSGTNTLAYSYDGLTWNGLGATIFTSQAYSVAWNSTTGQWIAGNGISATPYYATSVDGVNWVGRGNVMVNSVNHIAYPLQREKNYSITNTQWTGRTTTQNFRVISA